MLYNIETINTWLHKFLNQDPTQPQDLEDIFFEWLNSLTVAVNYSFSGGISGAAWLWLFLKNNNFLENIDEDFFYDLDDQIYRYTKKLCYEKNDIDGLILLTNYYQMRLNDDSEKSIYRKEALIIALKLIIGHLLKFIQETSFTDRVKVDIILRLGLITENLNFENKLIEICNDYIPKFLNRFNAEQPRHSAIILLLKLGIVCNRINIPHIKDQLKLLMPKYTLSGNLEHQDYINLLVDAYEDVFRFQKNKDMIAYLRELEKDQLCAAVNLMQITKQPIISQ